jgi:hypothetical protein
MRTERSPRRKRERHQCVSGIKTNENREKSHEEEKKINENREKSVR